jgi:uncharacterized FlaG/YvyC family protein
MRIESSTAGLAIETTRAYTAPVPAVTPVKREQPTSDQSQELRTEQTAVPAEQKPNLEQTAQELSEVLSAHNISLKFSQDKDSGSVVIEMIDGNGEKLRQIPSEVTLRLSAVLGKLQGKFFDRLA